MGYICPDCGEGLPDDTPCPCTMTDDDADEVDDRPIIRGPLTAEIKRTDSPVRGFLSDTFTIGLRDVQSRYRVKAPSSMAVPTVPRAAASPGTVGTAADWLLRFLLYPQPALDLAVLGVQQCRRAGIDLRVPLIEIAEGVGVPRSVLPTTPRRPLDPAPGHRDTTFIGPRQGNKADPEHLARCCWALALLTEVWRGGPIVAARGPLSRFQAADRVVGDELLGLTPPAGLDQLAGFRHVFETTLIPQLASRRGPWTLGPTFTGSRLIRSDADLIAAGLLLELKTTTRPSLAVTDVLQVVGYALLDFDDAYHIDTVGIFSARYAYLATWQLGSLLDDLAGRTVDLRAIRNQFRRLLTAANRRGG